MSFVLSFFASRTGGIVAGVVFALVALIVNNSYQRSIGAQKVVAKLEKAADATVKKADAARRSVDGVPDSGLFDHYRRD